MDSAVGRFVEGLREAGLGKGTVLVLTSSNGEGFRPDLNRVHHGGRLHDDVLHVPLVVRAPGLLEPGTNSSLVSLLDVAPTLAELAGLPEQPLFSGRPLVVPDRGLLASVRGPRFHSPKLPREPVVAEEAAFRILPSGQRVAATEPQYALYLDWVTFLESGDHVELYDLKDDPDQEHDRSGEHAKGVKGLRAQVRRIAEAGGAASAGPDAEQLEQLRSLGYVQ